MDLFRFSPRPVAVRPPARTVGALAPCHRDGVEPDAAPDSAFGPGWFESSWDLGRGLEVREDPPRDARSHA